VERYREGRVKRYKERNGGRVYEREKEVVVV
jgi:hypothetical protein